MNARGLEHQFLCTDLVKGHFDQRVPSHRGDGEDHSVAEGLMVDHVAGVELQQRRGSLCGTRRRRGRLFRAAARRASAVADAAAIAVAVTGAIASALAIAARIAAAALTISAVVGKGRVVLSESKVRHSRCGLAQPVGLRVRDLLQKSRWRVGCRAAEEQTLARVGQRQLFLRPRHGDVA